MFTYYLIYSYEDKRRWLISLLDWYSSSVGLSCTLPQICLCTTLSPAACSVRLLYCVALRLQCSSLRYVKWGVFIFSFSANNLLCFLRKHIQRFAFCVQQAHSPRPSSYLFPSLYLPFCRYVCLSIASAVI